MKPINLFDRSPNEVKALLASGSPVYLPVNPQEYHGPHLPIHTDGLVSAHLMRDLHTRLLENHPDWPFWTVPDLRIGTGLVPGPGSRPSSFTRVRAVVRKACRALVELGALRVVVMTFHGDPLHNMALQAGVDLLVSQGVLAVAPMQLTLREMMDIDLEAFTEVLATIDDPMGREAIRRGFANDYHAGFSETAVMLHYAPEAVSLSYRELPPCPPFRSVRTLAALAKLSKTLGRTELGTELAYIAKGLKWFSLDPFPGYTGRPHLANRDAGAAITRYLIDLYVHEVEDVFALRKQPILPVMSWLPLVTGNGRLMTLLGKTRPS